MSQAIELVVVGNGQAQQAFQIGADHDDGGHQIAVFLPVGGLFTGCEEQIHLRDTEFQDKVGQQLSLAQSPPQQLQTTAPFEAVLLQLGRRVIAQDMDTIVAGISISILFTFFFLFFFFLLMLLLDPGVLTVSRGQPFPIRD